MKYVIPILVLLVTVITSYFGYLSYHTSMCSNVQVNLDVIQNSISEMETKGCDAYFSSIHFINNQFIINSVKDKLLVNSCFDAKDLLSQVNLSNSCIYSRPEIVRKNYILLLILTAATTLTAWIILRKS